MKFKVGQTVKIKKDLLVGVTYFNEDKIVSQKFSQHMKQHAGKEATIIRIENDSYVLDIDKIHRYSDGMLEPAFDELALTEYKFNYEVEKLIQHMTKQHYQKLIDKALDERMFETDPEGFQKLVDIYKIYS